MELATIIIVSLDDSKYKLLVSGTSDYQCYNRLFIWFECSKFWFNICHFSVVLVYHNMAIYMDIYTFYTIIVRSCYYFHI